jgi:Holliday junction resolvase RusA-like endonuclease
MSKQTIFGSCPSKSNSYRIIRFNNAYSLGKTNSLKKYEKDFYIQCNLYRDLLIDGYFEFYMDVFYPNQRSDLDNSAKVVLDCLQKVKAIVNDNKCTKMVLRKFLDKDKPRIEFFLKKIDGF